MIKKDNFLKRKIKFGVLCSAQLFDAKAFDLADDKRRRLSPFFLIG